MLFHLSIDADDPRRVAQVIAELWGGVASPFPPVIDGSWIAMAGDDRNTAVEVYPRGTELVEAEGDADAVGAIGGNGRHSSTHFAMATAMGVEQVLAIAKREGWPAKYRKRGGAFGVLELWIEGSRMIEVLTPEMQAEYRATMTVAGWNGFLASVGMANA
ncbi:hypothetical protein FHS95_002656 [Sphingomonas naasensis]|uniref:Uncharacterized protein n=1 Tax=Sphingomonas naasensis TaxID=1344951 RepID=A0A4S1WJH2_9SPHN|nr:hypothetical protein [Sphingomonas naasensis]NIJ20964.1 hypothetical protein [Sphingomonas naasensis]TGX43348.1 hypothetical protein E5A74_09305 [Sphingomonas naasensis]